MMKYCFLLTMLSITFGGVVARAQEVTPEQRQQVLRDLDDPNPFVRSAAIDDAAKYGIVEAIPIIEQKIWNQAAGGVAMMLRALDLLDDPNLYSIARALIDSAETMGTKWRDSGEALAIKVAATRILFKFDDFSSTQYVFDILKDTNTVYKAGAQYLLKSVVRSVPAYADSARIELLRIARQAPLDLDRWGALGDLVELFGQEMFIEIVHTFMSDPDASNRFEAMRMLFQLQYPQLNQLLRARLSQEVVSAYRGAIAESLLVRYGSPSDYDFVTQHLLSETHPTEQALISRAIQSFKPRIPSSNISVFVMIDTLVSTKNQTAALDWLSDAFFASELEDNLQSARSYLSLGDSLKCTQQVKAFQFKVDEEYKDSLDGDSRSVTVEGWKFLYYNAQYILDRLPSPPSLSAYSLFAMHSMHLEQNAKVFSGDVGVNAAGSVPFLDSEVELSVGIGVTTAASSALKAHRIKVKSGATVNSSIYYNELENNGTITGSQNTPLSLPLVASLPEFKQATPGAQNIEVPQNGTQTLPPGSYGDIMVRLKGRLTFTGGNYHFNSIATGDDASLLFQSPSEVRIAGKFDSGEGTTIGPEDTTTMSADQVIFYVGGINGSNGNLGATPKAAKIGIGNKVHANFYVPNGTLWIRQNSEAKGQFIGKDVDVGIGVKVWR